MFNKYLAVFKNTIIESHANRAHMLVWVINGIVWVAVFPFVWLAVYGARESVAGFERTAIFAYFFLIPVIDIFINSWVYESIQHTIKDGTLINFVQKPLNYIIYMFARARGWQTTQAIITLIICIPIYFLLQEYIHIPTPTWQILWLLPVTLMGITIAYLFGVIIGFVSFFTIEGRWMKDFWWMLTMITSGYLIPIQFYPDWLQQVLSYTPFPLILQTPIFVILQRLSTETILFQLAVGLVCILILIPIVIIMWKQGSKRFDSIGI